MPPALYAQGTCTEWSDAAIGVPLSGSTNYEACNPGTITITSAGSPPNGNADRQYMVQRELCGNGTLTVKVESISGGRAGLEIRADNMPGAVKAGLKTLSVSFLTRYARNAPDAAQTQQNAMAQGYNWLRLERDGNAIALYWSANGSNWTPLGSYTLSLPDCAYLGIFVESSNAAVATGVFSNLSVIEFSAPGNPPVTTFSFAAGSLSADAGEDVQVCVNIADPCACAPASVQVALQGNAAPHLSGFSTQTLEFQTGDTQKCFTLPTSTAPGEGLYTLVLQTPTGGNAAAIGTPASLALTVTGEPETPTDCPWAGPDVEICRGESVVIGCPDEVQPPAGSFYCYKWAPEEGLDDPSLPQPTASPQQTTTYTLYVTDNQGNVVATDGVLVRVRPLPEVEISADPSPPIIVNGVPVTLTASTGPGDYLWELEGVGSVPNGDMNVLTVSIGGEYTFRVTDIYNCQGTAGITVAEGTDEDACAEAIREFFVSKGFLDIPITIIGNAPGFTVDSEEARLKLLNPCLVQDEAQVLISLGDDELNIATPLLSFLDDSNPLLAEFTGTKKGIVTHNDNFCLNLILSDCGITELSTETVEATFADVAFGYWAHIWKAPPGGGESTLFISARSPLSEHFWTTGDPLIVPEARQALDYVKDRPLHPDAAFPSTDRVIVNNTFDILAATSIEKGINLDIPYISSIADCTTQTDFICLSSAGAPVRIVAGSVISFGIKAQFRDLIDPQALSRFTIFTDNDLVGHYRGMVRLPASNASADYFGGYKNLLTTKFYEYPGAAISGPQTVRLGVRVDQSVSCAYFYTYSLGFTPEPAYPPNQDRKAAGALVADFHNGPSGTFAPPDPDTYQPEIISLCPPPISFEAFRDPIAVQTDPQNSPAPNGWYFLVHASNGAIERFYAYYPTGTPELAYLRFTCNGWVPFDPPHRPTYDFLSALLQVFSEVGHIVLDVAGMIPVLGEPADFISGIWYLAEGNYSDAGFSFAALVPLLGAQVTAGKYVFKIADEAGNVRTLNKFLKANKTADGGAELFKVGGLPVNMAEWLGIRTFQNNFSPQQAQKCAEWMINLKTSGQPILKLFDESPAMFNAWKALDEAGASTVQVERLFVHLAELPANTPLLTRFASDPGIAKGWKLLDDLYGGATANKRLWDGDLIAKTTELSNDADFLSRIVPGGADDVVKLQALKDIVARNAAAPCRTCVPAVNAGNVHLKYIEDYLDDVRHFVIHCEIQDASKIIETVKTATVNWQIDEAAQAIRLFKENAIFADIQAINRANVMGDRSLGIFDIRLTDGTRVEQKSLTKIFMEEGIPGSVEPFAQNPRIINQLKNYFTVSDNLPQLRYSFDARKLVQDLDGPGTMTTNPFSTIAEAETWVKGRFQAVFQQNSSSIFQTVFNNSNLRTSLSLSNDPAVAINQFNSLVNNSNSVLFQFIKVE
ncbi:MAG: hypothetical protein KF852_07700 [Saprospiraceae bacterium]|nr:hypothetical protein [Saprospiraceae bacterium]